MSFTTKKKKRTSVIGSYIASENDRSMGSITVKQKEGQVKRKKKETKWSCSGLDRKKRCVMTLNVT